MNDYCIIGSGPSAISAAVALTRLGVPVTMLDVGRTLDERRRTVVERLSIIAPSAWATADVDALKEGITASSQGIPLKRAYGSTHPFDAHGTHLDIECIGADVRPSFARGGLSTVWGAGLLPFHEDDLAAWPISASELAANIREVLSFVPCTGAVDSLDRLFPEDAKLRLALAPTSQGDAFLADAARARRSLEAHGVFVGRSRLAVDVDGTRGGRRPCERCGMCLYGCPYELIYSSEYTLRHLRTLPNFRYIPGIVVDRLTERNGGVIIDALDADSGARRQFHSARLFLGAGVVTSTAIVLKSMGAIGEPIRLQDSFYFLLPLLRFVGVPNLDRERLVTLAQAFVVMRDARVSRNLVHLSVYGFNDLMVDSFKAAGGYIGRGAIGRATAPMWSSLASRTLILGGALHSDESPGLSLTVVSAEAGRTRVRIEGEDSRRAKQIALRVATKLATQTAALRATPLVPAIRFSPPGRGFHAGGSFPMRLEVGKHASDTMGRPFGFERVHLIDASCFPSIPATTITLPVMANAYRIAVQAAKHR